MSRSSARRWERSAEWTRALAAVSLSFASALACNRGELELLPAESNASAALDATPAVDHRSAATRIDGGRQFSQGGSGFEFECISSTQCGSRRPYCDPRTRHCVECLAASNCTRPAVCDTPTGRCVLPCDTGADCSQSAQSRCDPTRHICVECTLSAQCTSPASICNTSTGECVECIDSSQCALPWRYCATFRGECVECLNDQNCAPGASCVGGRCFTR